MSRVLALSALRTIAISATMAVLYLASGSSTAARAGESGAADTRSVSTAAQSADVLLPARIVEDAERAPTSLRGFSFAAHR